MPWLGLGQTGYQATARTVSSEIRGIHFATISEDLSRNKGAFYVLDYCIIIEIFTANNDDNDDMPDNNQED